jgi:hypothetical protein
MTTAADLSVADRLLRVLDYLEIKRAHFAASMLADVTGLAQAHPERIASLTLICPPRLDPSALRALGARLLIIAGDQGRPAAMAREAATSLPEATVVWLSGYFSPPWADVVADRTADVETALLNVLSSDQPHGDSGAHGGLQGAVAGITYHSQGDGPPLVLLPLSLACSQWDPLLSQLSTRFRTVTLGGPELGFLAMLEARGRSAGYLSVVQRIMDVVKLRPGEVILEVGCGSGVLDAGSPVTRRSPTGLLASTSTDIFSARPRPSPSKRVLQTSSGFRKETRKAYLSRTTMWMWRCRLRFSKKEMRTACSPSWSGLRNPADA